MDAQELARWTRFAAKGGIGTCTAVVDCIAQEMGEDLMFLKDDEITVLMQLPDPGVFLGHCEGVVGRFAGKDVRFHGKLKKPVMAKRASVSLSESPRPTSQTSHSRCSRDTTLVGASGHAKHPDLAVSVSGASIFSVGSASVYSEASTATSVYSAADAAFHKSNGSIHSQDTERDVPGDPEYGSPTCDSHTDALPVSASTSTVTSMSSGTSFASTSTHGTDPIHTSPIEPPETAKPRSETGFILVPPPLDLGGKNGTLPLRVSKSPKLSPLPVSPGEHPRSLPPGLPGSLAPGPRSPGLPGALSPGVRSPAFAHGAQAQYTFSSSPPLASPYTPKSSPNMPPVPCSPSAPLSPPPSSPLPPLPGSFSGAALPVPVARPVMGTAATAAASGRTSPLAALSSSMRSERVGEDGEEGNTTQSDDGRDEEDAHSDGEVGIGLSLMGALGGEDEEEEQAETGVHGATALAWTRYEPSSPISAQDPHGDEEEGEEDEDDGAYWDDIYDDYRYSRHSLASKHVSIMSRASGTSKASSKARAAKPPMPIPPDRPTSRPSTASDGTNGYPRPSFESGSSSRSLARPSMTRTASEDSTHRLPLTAQFPAVPMHVPVRTESRLRIVHEGYMQGGDEHGEKELQVEHGSTEGHASEVGLNIKVVDVTEEDDSQGQEVDARHLTPLGVNTSLSPLLHTTFGSPHSSRFTDFEEGSDQDHGRRHSNKSGQSSAEGGAPRDVSPRTLLTPTSGQVPDASPNQEPARTIVVDDAQSRINITVNAPVLETEAGSPSPPNVSTTVATDPIRAEADQPQNVDKSSFLRPRPHPNPSPHPFARTSMFLPHPNAPKTVFQSLGPMYGRTGATTYAHPAGSTPPGTTFFSAQILHQLRARRPPLTLFARCQPELSVSMGPVPILFSLDPFPPGKPMETPMRAATVSVPARSVPMKEGGASVETSRLPKRSVTAFGGPSLSPIPREGFVPQVGAARPRSRSFSSFGDHVPATPLPEKSFEEPVRSVHGVSVSVRKTSLPPALMPRNALPPLAMHNMNKDREPDSSPASPIVQSPALSTHSRFPPSPLTHTPQFVDTPLLNTNGALASPISSSPLADKDASTGRASASLSDPHGATTPQSLIPRQGSLDVPRNGSMEAPRQSSDSFDSPLPPHDSFSQGPRPLLTQELTVKTKLSLPALRMKASVRSKVDDAVSIASFPTSAENETVQVQDMDFELVKPTLPPVPGRASQDSTLTGREDAKPEPSPIQGDAASTFSHTPRSPLVPTPLTDTAESIDAHRQRELKWMALFPAIPPSQARKNKKVRKLLQEGVPSSVRYLVWCHLTDSKARALPGVYAKLGQRPPVPAFAEIERDVLEGFPDQPQLHTAQGPVASLLQAYLSMVPDIQYNNGLTFIAGHLLLLAPEEDAFWIFASMMDAHLRSYFAANTVQIEIDASLFSKALENMDPVLSKRLYMQLSIAPANITRPWFSTLFVGSLSVDHLHRVWDVFLYDGIPYLYRVGLVVVSCVRHLLLQATTEEAVLAHLARPPPACLPSPPELLVMAANMKLKDDDVRKQRAKMEQQLKKTTQARPPNGVTSVHTSAISLPRT